MGLRNGVCVGAVFLCGERDIQKVFMINLRFA